MYGLAQVTSQQPALQSPFDLKRIVYLKGGFSKNSLNT